MGSLTFGTNRDEGGQGAGVEAPKSSMGFNAFRLDKK